MSAYVQPFSTIDSRKKRTLWKTLSIMSFAVEGYNVDVGLVELGGKDENSKFVRKQLEVDFVVNRPPYRVYIQSAFSHAYAALIG